MRTIARSVLMLLSVLAASAARGGDALTAQEQARLVEAVRSGLMRVEYTLRYDDDDAPDTDGWLERCPNCGRFHGHTYAEDLIRENRPQETCGFLLTSTQVLTQDPIVHPRFIKRIAVRAGDQLIDARVSTFVAERPGLILELAAPVVEGRPLSFDGNAAGPFYAVTYQQLGHTWSAHAAALDSDVTVTEDGRRFQTVPHFCVIVNREGTAVGCVAGGVLPLDGSWKGTPLDWPSCPAGQMASMLDGLKQTVSQSLLPVTVTFRSPREAASAPRWLADDDADVPTEMGFVAVAYDRSTLVVVAGLEPKLTARVERILVRLPEGNLVEARYGHALREYGCFTACLDAPLPAAVAIRDAPIQELRDDLLLAASYRLYGKTPVVHYMHARVSSFRRSHEGRVYPSIPGDEKGLFVFDANRVLVALPTSRRDLFKPQDDYSSDESISLTPAGYLAEQLRNIENHIDPSNVPRKEEDEQRIAWLGVEIQDLDSDLAQVKNVSDITMDGTLGALVSYVYPSSPAAGAGLQLGDILLWLHVPQHFRPIPVHGIDELDTRFDFDPEKLADLPDSLFAELPPPWSSVENELSRMLTQIGFGNQFELEFYRDGQTQRIPFMVTESPRHFGSAKRLKSASLGLTVRELTYEVRRYFHLEQEDPGIVISKIEPGSRASVAGLRPYEIITRINDQPLHDVETLKAILESSEGELRMIVKQMDSTRIVKLTVDVG